MVKTKDGIIVLLFMMVVTLLNAAIKKEGTTTDVVDGLQKEIEAEVSKEPEISTEAEASKEPKLWERLKIGEKRETSKMPAVSEADLEAMQQQAELYITEESSLWTAASLVGYEYIGNYILQGKNKQMEHPYQIYLVNRVWMAVDDDLNDIIPYYHLVKFSDVNLSGADEWEINLKVCTPENGQYSLEKHAFTYVEGYGSIGELYTSVIEEKLGEYRCTANMNEDKEAQKYFKDINFTDMKWAEGFEEAGMGITGETAQGYEDSRLAKWAQISGKGVTEDGMYEYDAQGDTVTITKYVGEETEVVIPEEIVYRTKILLGSSAFQDTNITSVAMSDNVENVGFHTFHGCVELKEVILGEGVTTIEECAFYKCSSLESIEIPSAVSFIASNAFQYSAVTSISVKSGCETEGLKRDWSEPITVTYYN